MSLVFSNVGKLAIAFVAFAASIIALSVSINSVGKFDYARNKTQAASDYEYQVDLMTPTQEAGLYSAQTLEDIYYDASTGKKINDIKDLDAMKTTMSAPSQDHFENGIMLHAASGADAQFAVPAQSGKAYPFYLKNRIQIKSLLNLEINANTNP